VSPLPHLLLLGAACGVLACAAAAEPEAPPLCDGSDEVRWAHAVDMGGRANEPAFLVEYGSRRISIDGSCEFWLYDASLRGLRHGVIDAELASQLERELHFGSYASFAEVPLPVCLGSPRAWFADVTAMVRSDCVYRQPSIPRAFSDTVIRIERLAAQLDAIAERVWRPVQILPLAEPNVLRRQPVYDWNAPFDLAAQAVSWVAYSNGELSAPGIPVEDAATLARLDELRAIDIADENAFELGGRDDRLVERGLFVRDGDDRIFQVLVRDELPEQLFVIPER
jgi:hypothetical protein